MDLKIKISDDFNLTDKQVEFIYRRFSDITIEKAYKSTQTWSPRSRKYFKEALKHYSSYKKPIKLLPEVRTKPIPKMLLEKSRQEVKEIEEKYKQELYDCPVCGKKEFHSRMAHDWKVMELHVKRLSKTPIPEDYWRV